MVRARLYLICGNCGCNDDWEWECKPEEVCESEVVADQDVYLWCRNCSTLHSMNGNAKMRKEPYRRCTQCKAPKKGAKCWKCGEATFEPCEGWDAPMLPPIDRIRELAYEVGYAIGEHGSKERDLDVIAAPWTDKAVGNHDLLQYIAKSLGAKILSTERKPLGRYAATIQIDGWYKAIDISVCPKI